MAAKSMKKTVWWLILLAGIGLAGVAIYRAMQGPEIDLAKYPPAPPPAAPSEPAPPAQAQAETHFPVPQEEAREPLPPLDRSDSAIEHALRGLWSGSTFERMLQLDGFVRRVVATIDNLTAKKVAMRLMPLKAAPGKFLTSGKDGSLVISPDNAARYGAYVRLAETVDVPKLAALYFRFYPLFQRAYEELGYPKRYFNDRVVGVIDHLLAAPEAKGPIMLVRPKVMYQFADPDLEALSAGQKIMLRIGNDNELRIKRKLRELRAELTKPKPHGG
jgi:hypothetical protein